MRSRDFAFWLNGFFELQEDETQPLSVRQVDLIKRHLALVFVHEIDPSMNLPEPDDGGLVPEEFVKHGEWLKWKGRDAQQWAAVAENSYGRHVQQCSMCARVESGDSAVARCGKGQKLWTATAAAEAREPAAKFSYDLHALDEKYKTHAKQCHQCVSFDACPFLSTPDETRCETGQKLFNEAYEARIKKDQEEILGKLKNMRVKEHQAKLGEIHGTSESGGVLFKC